MIRRQLWLIAIYATGCLTLVPWCVWTLFTTATRDQAAWLIVLPLAWLISFWPLAGSLLAIAQVYRFMKRLDQLQASGDLRREFLAHGLDKTVIALVARDNRLPVWAVRWAVKRLPLKALLQAALEKDRQTRNKDKPLQP